MFCARLLFVFCFLIKTVHCINIFLIIFKKDNFYVEMQQHPDSSRIESTDDIEMPDLPIRTAQQQSTQPNPQRPEPVIVLDITETPDPEIEDYLFDFYYRKRVYEQNATSLVVNNQQH